ncbi:MULTISPECIES: branched-chain amino acid ABC transporter permease [Halorussus]|uniref:branched-chain amino acid ABC transporter permease n=1 Tax=Halorussus TaxID=1070314 RepID=UPI00209F6290|nr:branched-chain amino acid ABC transporter permease [Halorussus vallis]USZ78023.1 branched-chain amino acid ABC transporter permease [Halorussus vallis]
MAERNATAEDAGGLSRLLAASSRHAWVLLGALVVVAAALPALGLSGFYMTVVAEMFVFAVLALSWDFVGGQTGYPSFGNMAFFGFGAYTTAILLKDVGVAFPAAVLVAGPVAMAFALVIGLAVLRLRGGYFAIATLGVLLVSVQLSRNFEFTGGASGKILFDVPPELTFYYVFLAILAVETAAVLYLTRTQFGYVLNAIRDDEPRAVAMGVDTTYYKTAAWMLSALFTGWVGGAWGTFNTFIDPQTAYNLGWNVELITMALIGGAGTVAGPILGAFVLTLVIFAVNTVFPGWQLVALGLVIVATVLLLPDGIVGTVQERAAAMEYYQVSGGAAPDDTERDRAGDGGDGGGSRDREGGDPERDSEVTDP